MAHDLPVVCQLVHGLRVGGAEVLVARLARRLRERFHFHFVCLDELGSLGEELRREGFPVVVLDRRPGLDWRLPWNLAQHLRATHTTLIHAHQYTPFFYAMSSRLFYGRPPILFTEHGRWVPDYRRPRRIVANRLLRQNRDRVVGVGENVRHALIVNEGIPATRVGVVYNGVDLTPYREGHVERETVRREMGFGPRDFVAIQVARLVPIKDHRTALKAVAAIPQARLVLVGEGPEEAAIRETVAQLGLQERVRMLGLRNDVPRLLRAADAFLLSSINEGIPLTVIEAMAAGLPVVSTAAGGVAEVVLDGATGLLAPVSASGMLGEHLMRLARDDGERQRLGQAGRERAFARFSEDRMLEEYERFYREMLQ
jgi:glycosyltransferase involved in cell wall biosynthesis